MYKKGEEQSNEEAKCIKHEVLVKAVGSLFVRSSSPAIFYEAFTLKEIDIILKFSQAFLDVLRNITLSCRLRDVYFNQGLLISPLEWLLEESPKVISLPR